MKKLLIGVKQALSSSLSTRGSSSCFGDNGRKTHRGLRPLCHHLHGITGLSCYLAQDDVPDVTIEKGRKLFVKFCLFGKSFGSDFSHF
jgi:hypothetical protein